MLMPYGSSHSVVYNYIWTAQFAEAFAEGVIYPRWFPQSFEGLGSPTFYFYPPLAFWTSGTIALFGLSPLTAVALAAAMFSAGSGLAMYAWLKEQTPHALWGAIIYMLAPYHMYNFYVRGALAEYASFIWLPLIILSLARLPDKRWILPLALSYAALLITHIPSAVLATVFLIIPSALYRCYCNRKIFVPGLLAGLLGIALSGFYLFPAMALQEHIATDLLWSPYYQPQTWFPWNKLYFEYLVGIPALAVALIICGAAMRNFWGVITCVAGCAAIGLIPLVWNIDILAQVQFPWRLLGLVEFTAITGILLGPRREYLVKLALAVAIVPATNFLVQAVMTMRTPTDVRAIQTNRPDAPEYLPSGMPDTGITSVQRIPDLRTYKQLPRGDRIRILKAGPVVIGHADFPIWQVVHKGKIIPHSGPLISFDAPEPGVYLVQRKLTAIEILGWASTISAIFGLLYFNFLIKMCDGILPTKRNNGSNREHFRNSLNKFLI